MRGNDAVAGSLFGYVDLEKRVRPDHPQRVIRGLVNSALTDLSSAFDALYLYTYSIPLKVSPALCFPTNSPPCLSVSIPWNVWRIASPRAPRRASPGVSLKSSRKPAQPLSWTASRRNGLKFSKLQKAKPPSPARWHFTFTGRQMAASPAWCAGR
jgi:hypothetical protein